NDAISNTAPRNSFSDRALALDAVRHLARNSAATNIALPRNAATHNLASHNPTIRSAAARTAATRGEVSSRTSRVAARLNFYPASLLFPLAERVITACGFNVMRQTESLASIHRFLPFERRFDDQFQRARRRRSLTASDSRLAQATRFW